MPISVVFRRLFLITLLIIPQLYWLGGAWRIAARPKFSPIVRLATRLLITTAVVAMVAVLYDRIAAKFLPAAVSYPIAPIVQLWIFSSTFAFFLTKALHAVTWCLERIPRLFRKPASQNLQDPGRRNLL